MEHKTDSASQAKEYLFEKEDDQGEVQQVSGAFGERENLTEEQLKELQAKLSEQQ